MTNDETKQENRRLKEALAKAQALADAALAIGGPHWVGAQRVPCVGCATYNDDHNPDCPWEAYRVWRTSHGD